MLYTNRLPRVTTLSYLTDSSVKQCSYTYWVIHEFHHNGFMHLIQSVTERCLPCTSSSFRSSKSLSKISPAPLNGASAAILLPPSGASALILPPNVVSPVNQ
jgi:hypothetical protein